ncbi:efflux RND transporter periplasmic adaptor subunit [Baekduia sp. Peel2402]|uniref:efflux RND transporter periplasmic adaptor subunit n=1 Tax=Baekduia sp. Peel2402 TaxID=3458296 RepID=UPI00403E375F
MFRRLRANPLALLLGAVAAVAIGLAVSALGTGTPAARATERTVTVKKGVVQSTVSGSGNLEPSSTRDLSFGGSGTVTAVYVEAGDTVKKGQLLAKVDAAQLTVDDAQDAVDGTKLYAPVSGTIADVGVSVGDAVTNDSSAASSSSSSETESSDSSAAMTLVQINRYKMTVSLSESDIGKVKAGQMATVTVNAADDEQFAARVTDVDLLSSSSSSTTDSSSSSSAVSYSVTLKLTQSAKALKSGMSATAEIVTSQVTGLTVPTAAISGNTVMVVKNGVKATRQVQAGVAGDTTAVVTSGLAAGETVVVTSASAAAGAAASSSGSSSSSSQQSGSGSGLSGALGGGTTGGGTGGPPSGGGFPGGGAR